jgi:hypothetical protein
MNPTGHYPHMFEERGEKEIYPNDNRDPYTEEIKIPPPHPHKRKNINYFSHSKDPYFFCPPEQISNRKKKHKCRHDEPWRCRQTDESLVKASQAIKMNHGDVDRRTTRW